MNQMMSATADATAGVLGQEVEIAPPEIRAVQDEAEAAAILAAGGSAHIVATDLALRRRAGAPRAVRPQRVRRAYADGMRFATGRLLVAEDGSMQLEIEHILGLPRAVD